MIDKGLHYTARSKPVNRTKLNEKDIKKRKKLRENIKRKRKLD